MTSQIYVKISNFGGANSKRTNVNCSVAVGGVLFKILKDLSQELIPG